MSAKRFAHPEEYLRHRGWYTDPVDADDYFAPAPLWHITLPDYQHVNADYEDALTDQLLRDIELLGGLDDFAERVDIEIEASNE